MGNCPFHVLFCNSVRHRTLRRRYLQSYARSQVINRAAGSCLGNCKFHSLVLTINLITVGKVQVDWKEK